MGHLISFEGLDQSGKQTQAERLRDVLVNERRLVRLLSFPAYETAIGEEIERARRHEDTAIPDAFDYAGVRGLSAEVRQKLERVRPQTVGQAQRIPGVTPAAISLLLVHLARAARGRVA